MPHTTTKSYRPKRPDTRPNGKLRAKLTKEIHDKEVIQDLRVTSKRPGDRKEREVTKTMPMKTLTKEEKLIRALKKKLKGISELKDKKERGETLDAQQLKKLEELPTVLHDIEVLMVHQNIDV